ncbi:hypothetical protein ACVBEH_30490, partial [Roseateles sp. GG27B]
IKPGWENALEAALRERMGALEVSRLETLRAFEQDAPPARLAFYSPPPAGMGKPRPDSHPALDQLAALLRLDNPGLKALLNDW